MLDLFDTRFDLLQSQCWGSKYIEFGSGSRILAQIGYGSRVIQSILKEKIQISLKKNNFLWISISFLNYKNKLSPNEICKQSRLWIVNQYRKSYIFCLHFNLYLHVWIPIPIQGAPEYGSNTDPDPQHCFKPNEMLALECRLLSMCVHFVALL